MINGSYTEIRESELLQKMGLSKKDIEGDKKFHLMQKIDSINSTEVERIINAHGYPSKSLIGEPANMAIFYVIQHSNNIKKYLTLIKKAVERGDVPKTSFAMMEDRSLMQDGKEQIYGTQIKGQASKDGKWIYFFWPIKNKDSVGVWRKRVGFKKSLKDYLKEMDVEYKFYSLDDLDSL